MSIKRGGEQTPQPDKNPQELLDEEFDYQGTSRKQYEHALFHKVCSPILDDFLYLGSDDVARNFQQLQ